MNERQQTVATLTKRLIRSARAEAHDFPEINEEDIIDALALAMMALKQTQSDKKRTVSYLIGLATGLEGALEETKTH